MLDELKSLLGIATNDIDDKLNTILDMAEKRLCLMIGEKTVPDELNYIVIDVATARYNRIGSEGLSSHSVEGESLSFSMDDFEPFKYDIQSYLDSKKDASRGKLVFL